MSALGHKRTWRHLRVMSPLPRIADIVRRWADVFSSTPKILEPRRQQLSVADGVLDVAVAKISLQRPRIVPLVGERVGVRA